MKIKLLVSCEYTVQVALLFGITLNFTYSFLSPPQCQWAHIGASLHPRTVTPFRIPDEAFLAVLAANLLYAVIPSLIAMRCTSNTNFFLTVTKLPGMEGMPWVPDADTLVEKKHN